jgi:hypothetical protein
VVDPRAPRRGIKLMWRANQAVREQFDYAFLAGEWRIGQVLLQEEQAKGGEAYHQTPAPGTRSPEQRVPSLAEKIGNRTYGWRMKTIAPLVRPFLTQSEQRARR